MTEHTDHEPSRTNGGDAVADWRAAWKAARGAGERVDRSMPADETNPGRHGSRPEMPTWPPATAQESTGARTATSTLDPATNATPKNNGTTDRSASSADRHDGAAKDEAGQDEAGQDEAGKDGAGKDGDESDPESRHGSGRESGEDAGPQSESESDTGSLRATFVHALARARAIVEGRVDPASTDAGAPAAGSLSAPVAAGIAATRIPPVTLTSAILAAPPPTVSVVSGMMSTPRSTVLPAVAAPTSATAAAAGAGAAAFATAPPQAAAMVHEVSVSRRSPMQGTASSRGGRRVRRAHLKVTRIDPWTVMKVSFMLSIAFGIMTVVATAVVWSMLDAAGVFTSLNETIANVTGGADAASSFDLMKWVAFHRVLGATTLIAVVDVVLITALATLGAFLYNLGSALIGGVEVTLVEDQR